MKSKIKRSYFRVFSVIITIIIIILSIPFSAVAADGDLAGAYYFNNVKYQNKYIHINNNNTMKAEGETIELHIFNVYYALRWNVIYVGNDYYKIESQFSDLVLTAPTGYGNDIVTQTTYTGAYTQQWKFIKQSDGTYKVSPRSNQNCFLAAGTESAVADQDLVIRSAQSDDSDKWVLFNTYLHYWNSNSASAWSWAKYPSLYCELIESYSDFYFNSGVNIAKNQWKEALNITWNSASENSSKIQCYGASIYYFSTFMGIDFNEGVLGLTVSPIYTSTQKTFTWSGTTKTHTLLAGATIYIPSNVIRNGIPVTPTLFEQFRIITHEFGHALGYNGHSLINTDIMFTNNNPSDTNYHLTQNDIAHIKQFYN